MGASNSTSGTGRKNYYRVSYGKLSTRLKEALEGYSEISEAEVKSTTEKVGQLDLRNKYIVKSGDYPYMTFYDKIEGEVTKVEKDEYDKGINLCIYLDDADGDESIIQMDFYNKYSENLLNRLLNVKDVESNLTFFPYAIPAESEELKKKFYNQGVSVRENGEKLEVRYKSDDKDLPKTERIKDAKGKEQTSRVNRVDFLYSKVAEKFITEVPASETPKTTEKKTTEPDDLPF